MKHPLLSLAAVLTLAGCSAPPPGQSASWEERMNNPLFAEHYWTQLVDRMANLQIDKDPVLEDKKIADRVNDEKVQALQKAQKVRELLRDEGLSADFLPAKELIEGSVYVKDGLVSFSPAFITYPGIDLHVMLSNVVDPRDAEFPDETAIDLGLLQAPIGPQEYVIPEALREKPFRTVILYDTVTKRIYAFAQLG